MRAGNSLTPLRIYRFDRFRLDTRERILRRDGEPVAISPKAWEVLKILVEQGGKVVDKQVLMDSVWPETFVEENNLAFNISVLRKLLGDEASNPRFIETVPRRGYRFRAEVEVEETAEPRTESPPSLIAEGKASGRRWFGLAAVTLGTVAALSLFEVHWRTTPKLKQTDDILVADFANDSGDPVFNSTLGRGLTILLEQSSYLHLISERQVRLILSRRGLPSSTLLVGREARNVCQLVGGSAVLEGRIRRSGSNFSIALYASKCDNGDSLFHQQVEVRQKDNVASALSELARDFRKAAGEPVERLHDHDASLADATTSSIEAFEAYSNGWKILGSVGAVAALPHFRRATELDHHFAMAYAWLGRVYADVDESDQAMTNTQQAWRLKEHASDQEKFFIDTNYELFVTGNLQQAKQTAELWSQTYPRLAAPHFVLSGMPNKVFGNFENGITEARRGLSLEPDFGIGYYNVAVNYAYLEHFETAEAALALGSARGLENDEMVMLRYDLAFLRKDEREMARQAEQAHARPGSETWLSFRQACVLAYEGRLKAARGILRRAMMEAEFASQKERAGLWQANAAVREAFFGNHAEARQRAATALRMTNSREVQYGAALAFALSGDDARALQIVDNLRRTYLHDTCVQFSYVPVLQARLALNRNKPEEAIQVLQTAIPNETGVPRSMVNGLFGALYPAYMRGEAYLSAHKGKEAVTEFQKILQHRGIVVADPIGALAQLQLGRAQSVAGSRIRARAAYQEFLALWKNADQDIPILQQAEAEYAALN